MTIVPGQLYVVILEAPHLLHLHGGEVSCMEGLVTRSTETLCTPGRGRGQLCGGAGYSAHLWEGGVSCVEGSAVWRERLGATRI